MGGRSKEEKETSPDQGYRQDESPDAASPATEGSAVSDHRQIEHDPSAPSVINFRGEFQRLMRLEDDK